MQTIDLGRRLAAEGLGTAALLATVVGSGIMGEQLAGGNVALALLGNTLATGAILMVLILIFGPVSGGHFNPAVTLSFAMQGSISKADAVAYVVVQVAGGLAGVALAHVMFEAPLFAASANQRSSPGLTGASGLGAISRDSCKISAPNRRSWLRPSSQSRLT